MLEGLARNRWAQIAARVIPASYFALVCIGFWNSFIQTGKLTSLFWMISEGIVVALLVFRRRSSSISNKPWDWFTGVAGTFLILLVRPTGNSIAPDLAGFILQLLGTGFQFHGKAVLGRSFGIIAANRGVVVRGPYRIVRHPIYLGYLVTHVGFLLSNWSARNLAVYLAAYIFQVARIYAEERILSGDEKYREYASSVRYRLIPGLF